MFRKHVSNTVKILTYNIRHAKGMDGKVSLHRISLVIEESKADIVALQEVDKFNPLTLCNDS